MGVSLADSLLPFTLAMFHFIMIISMDAHTTESVAKTAIGLLGYLGGRARKSSTNHVPWDRDLAATFGERLKGNFNESWIKPFVKKYRKMHKYEEGTVNIANWAYKVSPCARGRAYMTCASFHKTIQDI